MPDHSPGEGSLGPPAAEAGSDPRSEAATVIAGTAAGEWTEPTSAEPIDGPPPDGNLPP